MSMAARVALIWLMSLLVSALGCAAADDAMQIEAGTSLITLKVQGTGYANVRALPDPRSATVVQLSAGTSALRATGAVKLYGDTWWVEIQTGTVTGWLNARLLGRLPGATPLQAFVNIDALQPTNDYAFSGDSYRNASVTSYDECARVCVGDEKCVGIEHRAALAICRLFDRRLEVTKELGADIAAKAAKTPAGGWSAQSSTRFDRLAEQGTDADGYRDAVAHSVEECTAACGLDERCAAFSYQRKKRICTVYEQPQTLSVRAGFESGIRRAAAPIADLAPAKVSPPAALPARAAVVAREQTVNARSTRDVFAQLFEAAGQSSLKATYELRDQGRLTFTLTESPLGAPMHAAALSRTLEGTFQNLAVVLGRTEPRIVHLAYYANLQSPPLILASTTHASAEDAYASALKLQKDIDDLSKAVGLGIDPLSLLKPLRR
jgi:PAN domain